VKLVLVDVSDDDEMRWDEEMRLWLILSCSLLVATFYIFFFGNKWKR